MNIGRHLAKAIGIDFGIAGTGTEQVAVTFEVTEGECVGETIGWYGSFTDKATKYTIQALRACGWKGDDLSEIGVADMPDPVELVVQEDEDLEGNPVLRVRYINRPGSGGAVLKSPMTPDQRKAFASRLRGACMAEKPASTAAKPAATPKAKAARQPGGASIPDDDEIPF